ncbi:MAG: hypothetical protein GY696_22535 [Gammaproteobacteria bacterium]|nr:hypothetical protein [Gammaproteobacteria bacterium]
MMVNLARDLIQFRRSLATAVKDFAIISVALLKEPSLAENMRRFSATVVMT